MRRPWIFVAQSGIAISLLIPVGMSDITSGSALIFLAWTFFAVNCFCSMQDVATDALAVDLLSPTERGRILSFMWASQLAGIAVGGAGMALVVSRAGMTTAMLIQAGMAVAVLTLVLFIRERPGDRLMPWGEYTRDTAQVNKPFGFMITIKELLRALSNRTTATLVLVACGYNILEGLYDPLSAEFFIQDLGWSADRFATSKGTYGLIGEVTGALLGGYLADKFGRRRTAGFGMFMLLAMLLGFVATVPYWDEPWYPFLLTIPLIKGGIAFTTVAMFALFVKCCWTTAAATQFTLYMAVNNLGYALGAKLNRWLEYTGLELTNADYFAFAGLVMILPMLLLLTLDPDGVAARKRAEEAALAGAA